MGCQGRRGSLGALCCALLLGALVWAGPASASTITIGDVEVGESGAATFTLTRSASFLAGATSVSFQTVAASAGSPSDYAAASGSVGFGGAVFPTTQVQYVAVAIRADALDEADESFRLVIGGPEVVDGEATATITDDDAAPSLSVADSPAVTEGAAAAKASFAVRLSAASGRAVTVAYATFNGSATAGQDYAARAGTLVLPAGSTQAPVDVAVLDDGADEPAEGFELRLSAPVAAGIADASGAATIVDDDEPPATQSPAETKPPATTGQSTSPPTGQPGPGSATPGTGSEATRGSLGVSSPRLKRPSTVLVTVSCPQTAGRCSGRITLFSIPNLRSRLKALRRERMLGRLTFSVAGGRAQTLSLALGRTDRGLLQRSGRMRVRAYAITQDSAGHTGVRTASGTLIARTAHSSPSRKP